LIKSLYLIKKFGQIRRNCSGKTRNAIDFSDRYKNTAADAAYATLAAPLAEGADAKRKKVLLRIST
jgi:predicted nucleic acid-binding protein